MQDSSPVSLNDVLEQCIALSRDLHHHPDADRTFSQLREQLMQTDPTAADLVSRLWQELIAARRSAAFWQQISDVERDMSEKMVDSHLNLQQNYLRLVQEQ